MINVTEAKHLRVRRGAQFTPEEISIMQQRDNYKYWTVKQIKMEDMIQKKRSK
jgi:hypothetical protein